MVKDNLVFFAVYSNQDVSYLFDSKLMVLCLTTCVVLCWPPLCCQNSPEPSRHELHYVCCGNWHQDVAMHPFSCISCKVRLPLIRLGCPAHSTDAWLEWDLKNLEVKLTPQTHHCASQIFVNHFSFWPGALSCWGCTCSMLRQVICVTWRTGPKGWIYNRAPVGASTHLVLGLGLGLPKASQCFASHSASWCQVFPSKQHTCK